jgi:uncharacterized protein YukE
MTSIIEFLNQPIVLTLITLSVGSFLLNLIADRRSRKTKLRDEAIVFLTETGNDINSVVSTMHGYLEGHKSESYENLVEGFNRLFAKRMSVQIGSQAYLDSEEFHQQYDRLVKELERVAKYLDGEQESSEQIISKIQERRNRLGKAWPIENETQRAPADKAADELMHWMDMIMNRTTHLLSNNLKLVLG